MEHGGLSERSLRPSEVRQVHLITTASTEAHVEHDGCNVVLGHTLEHIVCRHGRRPPRQHPQPPRHGAAAPSRPQLRAAHGGGAPRCRHLKERVWRAIASVLGARSYMQPLVPLDHSALSRVPHDVYTLVLICIFDNNIRITKELKVPPPAMH